MGAGAVVGAAGALAYAVRAPASSLLAPSVHRGVRTRPAIALTFDDGPSESTPILLDVLLQHGAAATFFQCGANVRRLPDVSREVAARGHEIGNHSDTHPMLQFKSRAFILEELERAQDSIASVTGARPRYFRAPYGVRWFGLREAQRAQGLMGVMWTTIALDWKLPVKKIVARLLAGARNGAIFCLHDGRGIGSNPEIGATIETVRRILPELREAGFQFEKVSEILCPTKS
jgi:peptidoglycan/xylan/chitin deacetylase (PgdA/CDA1 family)